MNAADPAPNNDPIMHEKYKVISGGNEIGAITPGILRSPQYLEGGSRKLKLN